MFWWIVLGLLVISAGGLLYGGLVEAKRIRTDAHRLSIPGFPKTMDGFKVGFLADFHLQNRFSVALGNLAIQLVLKAKPDIVILGGDIVGFWTADSEPMIRGVLAPLAASGIPVVVIAGNHEYKHGDASQLKKIVEELGFTMLQNQNLVIKGICWVGIDSYNANRHDVQRAFAESGAEPKIVLWHEPDLVHLLPKGAALLQLSGHSHGGQFIFPGGFVPMTSRNGKKYKQGFFSGAPTPLFVTRGVGTTGPPSRFLCPPEVAILTLICA